MNGLMFLEFFSKEDLVQQLLEGKEASNSEVVVHIERFLIDGPLACSIVGIDKYEVISTIVVVVV